ncbi:helix-turn-helix domain-containing protein [Paenibacillus sp. FSL R7-0216]|uniref:helix-turn-helix domain-containing protein n=1 Tax=Paenibacillus sp. FSL R7-0216 TaxID=2921677 RepID=UPI0030D72C37
MSLGSRLKKEREIKGWSQIYVAEKLGITNTVLSNYERDYRDPDTTTLAKLADLYDVDADYLLGRSSTRKKTENSLSFFDGPDKYTPDEIAEMEAALERYREMKRRAAEEAKKDIKK